MTQQIDNYEEAMALVADLEATLPFNMRPEKRLVKLLREQGIRMKENEELEVIRVLYMGDPGGITVNVKQEDTVLSLSITHVIMLPNHPLVERVKDYQKNRIRGLMLQNTSGFASKFLSDRTPSDKKKKRGKGF